jgi:Spy/CpxP family protein refolding chaperone
MTMKRMLKQLGIAALLVCMFTLAKAQEAQMPSAEARASKMTEWMKSNLNLTADQASKVQDLNMKYAVKMDSLKNSNLDKQNRFDVMKSEGEAKDAEMKSILTADQYKTYQEKKQEMKSKYKDKDKDKS